MPGLIAPDAAVAAVVNRLGDTWSQVVTADQPWRVDFPLSPKSLTGGKLKAVWPQTHPVIMQWDDWFATAVDGIGRTYHPARFDGASHPLPGVLYVATIDVAAALAGQCWEARLARARGRYAVLAERFPALSDPAELLRATDDYHDIDFDLACRAGAWFAAHPESGLTSRQVPVEGMGTKWLARRSRVVRRLAGLSDLGLIRGRPPRVHVTYLDRSHLDAGGRRHDVVTLGDRDVLAYRPRTVVISENRDTAQLFGDVPGGIAIEGDGNGPGAVPSLDWVRDADVVWYWGDMDAKGLEILEDYRVAGVEARSLFMDVPSYARWERFGVDHDHDGKPIGPRPPRVNRKLESEERALYSSLCDEEWTGHRRIEQERIPLAEAVEVVRRGTPT